MNVSKDPNAVLDYTVDWTAWLDGDTITASTWVIPTGLTKNSDTNTTTNTTAWITGGTLGEFYDVVNRITTAAGRVEDQTLRFIITEH